MRTCILVWSGSGRRGGRTGFDPLGGGGKFGYKARNRYGGLERVEGIEPSTKAWEAFVLPLNYTRVFNLYAHLGQGPIKNPRYQLGKLE
jgi:hypothetical protein